MPISSLSLRRLLALALLGLAAGGPTFAQPAPAPDAAGAEAPPAVGRPAVERPATAPAPASAPAAIGPAGSARMPAIEWEVRNRFRLFRNEADFKRHVAAYRGDGVLAAEDRLARETDGRGWAAGMLDQLCLDRSGQLVQTCERDGEREVYLSPADHPVSVVLSGMDDPNAKCDWTFDDGASEPRRASIGCQEDVRLRVVHGRPTRAGVDITRTDGTVQHAETAIAVRDLLIAGLGDSIAAGEGNPDRPVALDDGGFCFRRFLAGSTSEYYRPGRAGYGGDRSCNAAAPGAAAAAASPRAADWTGHGADWMSASCHRSLYGYQLRTALALAVENPQLAVTFLPLACSGARIDAGIFNTQRARECGPAGRGSCRSTVPAQITQLQQALSLARRQRADRDLDLVLLTVGANDIFFSGLVADVILQAPTERLLFDQAGMTATVDDAKRALDSRLPASFAKLRAALKPLVGGNLAKVVFVSYADPTQHEGGAFCPGGRRGFDVHPAFDASPERLAAVADFSTRLFLPRLAGLARCEGGTICRDPDTERMTLVDAHQGTFADHGFCAAAAGDPVFDRDCFRADGDSFEKSPTEGAVDPMACQHRAGEFRPYAPRARWIRTANDSYFTAMTYAEGLPAVLQPSDIHDAIWGATSAVYGGAIHPTAEGHAAMADAALPAVRAILDLPAPAAVTAEPLPPAQ